MMVEVVLIKSKDIFGGVEEEFLKAEHFCTEQPYAYHFKAQPLVMPHHTHITSEQK
jgi:hypothetical protein